MNEDKLKLLEQLQKAEEMYVLMSGYTRMPYVVCDEETFDDEVFLFFDAEAAKQEAKRLMEQGNPIAIAKVEPEMRLEFFTSLFPIGVNCLRIEKGTERETTVQHNDLIRRDESNPVQDGKVRVENSELHLTALYFTQEYRKRKASEIPEELAEIYEEMQAHFARGQYIVPSEEEKGIPMLREKEGKTFLPIFTDFQEFRKFNRDGKLKGGVVKAERLSDLMTEEISGVTVNPFGVNLILTMNR